MNTNFHNSFIVIFRRKFSVDTCRGFHLTLAMLLHYLAKSEIQYIRVSKTIPSSLWSPYVIGQTIIFMAPLWNRAGHYIFILFLLLLLSSSFFFLLFFPRLISAVEDWMSTILPHMVWPQCEFRMQVWNMLHAARRKCRTQKSCQKSPSGHHSTTLSGYIFATKAYIDNRKKTC